MVTLYTDERMAEHRPPPRHPERPERLRVILKHLERTGRTSALNRGRAREASREELLGAHDAGYLDRIAAFEAAGGGHVEADTWVNPGTGLAARLGAGCAVEAVAQVVRGVDRRALCLIRPPGHHARPSDPMGFCIFNNVAVAAADALARHELSRVLIVDFDVHHGNGTQEMFYEDDRVGFLSIHRYPFYPGSGAASETGRGRGLGLTRNLPIRFGTSRAEYHTAFETGLFDFADHFKPELVLLSAGFDAHEEDPVGSLGLDLEDFERITRATLEVAAAHSQGRLVSVLEGGYNAPILAASVAAHLDVLIGRPETQAAPPHLRETP